MWPHCCRGTAIIAAAGVGLPSCGMLMHRPSGWAPTKVGTLVVDDTMVSLEYPPLREREVATLVVWLQDARTRAVLTGARVLVRVLGRSSPGEGARGALRAIDPQGLPIREPGAWGYEEARPQEEGAYAMRVEPGRDTFLEIEIMAVSRRGYDPYFPVRAGLWDEVAAADGSLPGGRWTSLMGIGGLALMVALMAAR